MSFLLTSEFVSVKLIILGPHKSFSKKLIRNLTTHYISRKGVPKLPFRVTGETLTLLHAKNKGADQLAHLRRLICTFVIHFLDSRIPTLAACKIKDSS